MAKGSVSIGANAGELITSSSFLPIGQVVLVDASGTEYKYPSTCASGYQSITKQDEFASTERATAIYNEISGYTYKPFQANSALVNPRAELGDDIVIGSANSTSTFVMVQESKSANAVGVVDVSAPTDEEAEHEYSYESTTSLQQKREEQKISERATYTSLENGTTTIDGGCIKTGEVDANRIKLGGKMTVYQTKDSGATSIGGYIGYTTVNSRAGMYVNSQDDASCLEVSNNGIRAYNTEERPIELAGQHAFLVLSADGTGGYFYGTNAPSVQFAGFSGTIPNGTLYFQLDS